MENNLVPYLTKNPTVSLYSSSKPLFGFSVMHNQFNNYSSIPNPLIIVYSAKTFEKGDAKQVAINTSSYLSNGQILTTNREMVNQVFEKYHLQNDQGSFFNGYQVVSTNLATQINKRNLLFGVNILCLLSSLLLISLLNSIYLYQNRKTFLLQRLSGKSWLDIHMVYLAVVMMLTVGVSIIARLWLHVPNEALIVPVIYLLLVCVLFALQVYREREANVLYLKGL
ncbi:DUF1430 domain-containing protein [Lactococcus allomyrinae]|uniref:DUF1430 domain-containing protein n=1 Tax=Lactococcus allomyrinae TaxID=2419773 RepID=A0A387BIS9_9LACT|nr:DUF1430 domain-containing protein [Lactococcus allomyrinae]AYG01016.1 DUF1430 domain-containing protein [Lactococcus allomyrinae]